MPAKIETLSRFSPGNCEPELLESILVGRGELVSRLEKSVLDSIATGAGHHWLLVGPRGVGKTHLLAILFNRIDTCEEVRQGLAIAYMKEEERGVASFLEWLVRILRAFARRWEAPPSQRPDLDLHQRLHELKALPLDQAQAAAERLLLDFVGDRRVLLLVENLGEIFSETKGMGRQGQRRFRDLLQQHPVWTVIASTQALFEDIQSKEAPFYGFFKVHHLPMLTFQEGLELLCKLAQAEGLSELARFFRSETGQGRIRAIHEITGGNPRLLVIFYQFVDRESLEELARPFLEMVDSLTSYYQEQMQPLPALQQKIVEFLCERRSPATVKEIARSCFITSQSASAQLKRLAERRYVQSTSVGRESFYELREPLFRICFEVKENMGHPIRLFVDFLGRFYSMEELRRKYRGARLLRSIYEARGVEAESRRVERELTYLGEALAAYHPPKPGDFVAEGVEPGPLDRASLTAAIDDFFSHRDYREAVRLADAASEQRFGGGELLLKSASGRQKLGDLEGALERLRQLVQEEPENVHAWVEKGVVEWDSGDLDAAEASYRRALEINAETPEALIRMGLTYLRTERHEEARACFTTVTEIAPDVGLGWLGLGLTCKDSGDMAQAREFFSRATKCELEAVVAWYELGVSEWTQGDYGNARRCFLRMTELAPEETLGWRSLGFAQGTTGDVEGALASFSMATETGPEEADAWAQRGFLELLRGDYEAARESLVRATELETEDPRAWSDLALAQSKLGDLKGARANYLRSTELAPDDPWTWLLWAIAERVHGEVERAAELLSEAEAVAPESGDFFNTLAEEYRQLGRPVQAIERYRRALELAPGHCSAHFHLALALFEAGDFQAGMEQLGAALEAGQGRDWAEQLPLCLTEILTHLLASAPVERLPSLVQSQKELFEAASFGPSFIQGFIGGLTSVLRQHETVPQDRLRQLRDRVVPELAADEDLSVVCRLFETGVRYLESEDPRVLLELPLEERASLERILQAEGASRGAPRRPRRPRATPT